jgi:hypothetical protein
MFMAIDMQNYWYSPAYVIYMAEELVKTYGQEVVDKDTHNFQKVGEMKCSAIMLLALNKVLGNHFFMQASKDNFPDVWTLYQEIVNGKKDTKYQTVEVVTYEAHSSIEVGDFILKSKLANPKKSYDEETIILCYIRKAGTFTDFNIINEKLKKHKFKPTRVFLIGNMIYNPNLFSLTQVWPTVHSEVVDYVARTKAYPLPHRMMFKKGIVNKIDYKTGSNSLKTNAYKPFYIDEVKVKKKYSK